MIPVQAIVMQFGFSFVPQETSAGGTGIISVAPGQCTFFIDNHLVKFDVYSIPKYAKSYNVILMLNKNNI